MENNVYETPESDLTTSNTEQRPLASRWARLGGSLIDAVIMMLILIPIQYFTGGFDNLEQDVGLLDGLGYQTLMGFVGVIIFIAINGTLLARYGQTVGKKLIGTQIVSADTGEQAGKDHLIRRYVTYFGCNLVPVIGGILSLINICFIFGETKQCLHDRFGGTLVVNK
jgi:uncharacterized RDD family membrane protein YckC